MLPGMVSHNLWHQEGQVVMHDVQNGWTCLHNAAFGKDAEAATKVAKLLMDKGKDICFDEEGKETKLLMAQSTVRYTD